MDPHHAHPVRYHTVALRPVRERPDPGGPVSVSEMPCDRVSCRGYRLCRREMQNALHLSASLCADLRRHGSRRLGTGRFPARQFSGVGLLTAASWRDPVCDRQPDDCAPAEKKGPGGRFRSRSVLSSLQ